MPIVLVGDDTVERRSTEAAADFVAATRLRMRMEIMRNGEGAVHTRRYRNLADGIRPESLRVFWPQADIHAALREDDEPALKAA